MGGVNEVLAVYLMAAKLGVPVCPHAGGVGLCEMVQHLQVIKKLMELKKLKLNVKIKIILIYALKTIEVVETEFFKT